MALIVVDHPLVQHKMALMRDARTGPKDFRALVKEVATLMAYEATRDLELDDVTIRTPLKNAPGKSIHGKKVAIIPILRAGLGMVEGILDLIPNAKVGHVGIYRNEETLQPIEYYHRFPEDLMVREILVLDPMLATGGSATACIQFLRDRGAKAENIRFLCLVSCHQGIEMVRKAHPEINIYTAVIDPELNERGYIVPGLGDAGDRMFGTI